MGENEKKTYDAKKEYLINSLTNAICNGKKTYLCPNCEHKDVCSKIEEPEDECKYFLDGSISKKYNSIYHLFQPIFDWIKTHYPVGEVKFIVDHNSARMVLDHGPLVLDKGLQCSIDPALINDVKKKGENA